jgi:hypothetical protein
MADESARLKTRVPRWHSILFGTGILFHLLMFGSLAGGYLNPLFNDAMHRVGQGADFFAVYQAAENVVDGVDIYARQVERPVVQYFYPYRYLPFPVLTLGQFFRLFSPATSYVVWILMQEVLLLINVILTRHMFGAKGLSLPAMSLWLFFTPYYIELFLGQFDFVIASLVFYFACYYARGETGRGDGAWIASVLLKSHTAILIPVFMKLGRWRSLAFASMITVVSSAPFFLMNPGSFSSFMQNITSGLSAQEIAGNHGGVAFLSACVLRLGGTWEPYINAFAGGLERMNSAIAWPVLVWTMAILCVASMATLKAARQMWKPIVVLWIAAYFLVYKHVWEAQYVLALPAFVLLVASLPEHPGRRRLWTSLFGSAYLLLALPTIFVFIDRVHILVDPEFYWSTAESILFHLQKPLGTIVLFILSIYSLLSHAQSDTRAAEQAVVR